MKKSLFKKRAINKKHKIKHEKHEGKFKIKDKRKKVKRKWWKKLLSFLIFCGSLMVFAVFGFFVYVVASCSKFDPNKLANQDQTIIYDSKENIIAKLGMEKRESVTYDKLPQVLVDAIIATEDSRFFEHNGVDGARFLKASIGQILGNSSAGGASTLTMQVIKNTLTSREQSIVRKFTDVYLAVFFMEKKYTKEEILELDTSLVNLLKEKQNIENELFKYPDRPRNLNEMKAKKAKNETIEEIENKINKIKLRIRQLNNNK